MDLRRERKKGSHLMGVLIIAALLCIALIAMLCYSLYVKSLREDIFSGIEGLDEAAYPVSGSLSLMLGQNGEDSFSYEIKEELFFKNGGSAGQILLKSPARNRYLMQVTIVLENGESVLKTGYILPGYMIENVKLDEKLKKGSYAAVALIDAVSPEDESLIGQLKQPVTITVLE